MKKSQIPLKFLVRLILGIVIAIPIIMFGCSLFRLSSQGTEYYQELYKLIEDVAIQSESADSLPLRMDKSTQIWGFSSQGNLMEYVYTQKTLEIIRPHTCLEGVSCLCLCKEVDYSEGLYKTSCEDGELMCRRLEKAKLSEEITYENFFKESRTEGRFENGFILKRFDDQRISQVGAQNLGGGKVAVCTNLPCE